jgi:hypothetical protein
VSTTARSEPTGVVLHDEQKDELVTTSEYLVLTPEGWKRLRLRVGRGSLKDV